MIKTIHKNTKRNRQLLTKKPSKYLARHGVYGVVERLQTPFCDTCPNTNECRFFAKGNKCRVKKAYIRSAINYFATLPYIRQEHALMVEVYAQEWFHRFWITKLMYSGKMDASKFERLDRVRDRCTKNMLKIQARFGLSPTDRTNKDLEEAEVCEVFNDETNGTTKDKK